MRSKYSKVSDPNNFVSDPGSRERIIYSAKINENHVIEVVPSGKEDWQDYIESFRDKTDMAYILKQLSLGDSSVLNPNEPSYSDFTQIPKSLAEAMQLQIDAEKQFYQLSIDTRKKFNNNFREWLFSAGTEDWLGKMDMLPKDIEKENEKGENKAPTE